jgi:ABC-2 type transport system permease protein
MNDLPAVKRLTGAPLFWNSIWARAYPRLIGTFRERSWFFFETILPLMSTISYIFVYRAIQAPEDYIGFVIIGGSMAAFWLNVLWSMGSQLYWDKDDGNLQLFVLSPAPLMAILLGMAIGGIVMTLSRALVVFVVCSLLFQVEYHTGSVPLLVIVFCVTMAALYGMGMMFSSIFLAAGREAWHFANLLQEPIYLVSGFMFPVRALGFWVAAAASILPLTLGLDAMRQLLFVSDPTIGFLPAEVEILILSVMAVVFIAAAGWMLAKLEEIGRRDGRLIERRR